MDLRIRIHTKMPCIRNNDIFHVKIQFFETFKYDQNLDQHESTLVFVPEPKFISALVLKTGSGSAMKPIVIRKEKFWIRDKHPGSATLELFTQKIVTKFSNICVLDPSSEIRDSEKHIPNTRSRGQKGTRSQIRIRNTDQQRHNILKHVRTSSGLAYFLYFSFLLP